MQHRLPQLQTRFESSKRHDIRIAWMIWSRNTHERMRYVVQGGGKLECLLLVINLSWGLWMLAPWWDSVHQVPGFRFMAFWPDSAWGGMMTTLGVLHLISWLHAHWRMRRKTLLVLMGFWVVLTWSVVISNPAAPAVATYSSIWAAHVWLYIHARKK